MKIEKRIMNLVRWFKYGQDGNIIEEKDDDPNDDEFEFSYNQFLNENFGIYVGQSHVEIDVRAFLESLKKHRAEIDNTNYEEVLIHIYMDRDGYFESAEMIGKREQTELEIRQQKEQEEKEREEKRIEKERKAKAREEKKLEKLREEIKKYGNKL